MKKKNSKGFLAQLLLVCFTIGVFAAFPTTAFADDTPADDTPAPVYNAGDIAVINTIIDTNGLPLPKANPADGSVIPAEWTVKSMADGPFSIMTFQADFVATTDKRVLGLRISNSNLTGALDVSGLSELRDLWARQNQLTAVNISGCTKLEELMVTENNLTTLDVSHCPDLMSIDCGGNDMPAEPIGSGVTGIENVTLFFEWNERNIEISGHYFYSSPAQKTASPSTPAPEPTPAPAPAPEPAPAAVVDLAPPSGGEGGTTVPANTNLVAVAASDGDVATMSQLVAAQGISGNLIQTLDIKLYDAAGNPTRGACTIRVNIPGLTANDRVTILHRFDNGSTERIAATARNGYCTFRVNKFSLFSVVVSKGAGSSGTTPNSPQTGVYN